MDNITINLKNTNMITALIINFVPCSPAPANGYNIQYRIAGSGDAYTDAGDFLTTPAEISVSYPDGTAFEGFIRGDCGDGLFGPNVGFTIGGGDVGGVAIAATGPCSPGVPNSSYEITGLTPGQVVTVVAYFSGNIAKLINSFLRADLNISSPDGTPGSASSACYSDTSSHPFSINATCVITATGTSAVVILNAVINNGSESATSVNLVITDIDGTTTSIPVLGCRGNSSTGGTC